MSVASRPRHPVTGRRFFLRARTPRELDAYLHRLDSLRTELRLGLRTADEVDRELRHLRHGPVTLERAAVSYLQRPALALNTKRRVRSLLATHLSALAYRPLGSLDAIALQAWIRTLERAGLHATSIGTVWRTVSAIGRHAQERGWLGVLPWSGWRPRLSSAGKRAPREAARTLSELARLLSAAAVIDEGAALLFRPADLEAKIACAALLGLRQGELGGLRWSDVQWGPPVVVLVARQWRDAPLKGHAQPKRIEAIDALGDVLWRHRERLESACLHHPEGPIFVRQRLSAPHRPRPYTRGQVLTSLELRSAVNRAGLPHVGAWSAHSLRDSFVTLEAASAGGDLARVASRSRHASLSSLVRYLRATTRDTAPPAFASLPRLTSNASGAAPLLPTAGTTDETAPNETPR